MIKKTDIIARAYEIGFADIGFTSAEPLTSHQTFLKERAPFYQWLVDKGMDIWSGTDPSAIFPEAKSIIVLIDNYYYGSYPDSLVGTFGRVYLDDDRITKNGLHLRLRSFREYLSQNGIKSKVPANISQRFAAAQAGVGTFGKNGFLYSNKIARESSWIIPLVLLVDQAFDPDPPTLEVDCPSWCKNTCIAACPTSALSAPRKLNPEKCISYLTYYGEGITPLALREPMGMWVYGCDKCQTVCPRNEPWMAQGLPRNEQVWAKAPAFELTKLLHMDQEYYKQNVWPHMFYMPPSEIWRWKMNVARAMGNSRNVAYIPDLIRAGKENNDDRVLGMITWALGKLGGNDAKQYLAELSREASEAVKAEIEWAISYTSSKNRT